MEKKKHSALAAYCMLLILLTGALPAIAQPPAQPPAGNPVLDAPGLKADIDKLKADHSEANRQAVLNRINANSPQAFATYEAMVTGIADNNFLKALVPPPDSVGANNKAFAPALLPANGSIQGGPFIASATGVADAVGTFIANRFKQEVEIAFLQKFRQWLENDSFPELSALLPTTKKVMLQNDPYKYTTFLEALKEAIRKDMNALPENLSTFLAGDPYHLAAGHSYYYPVLFVFNTTWKIVNGQSAFQVLNRADVDNADLFGKMPADYQSILRLIPVLSRTFTDPKSTANNGLIPFSKLQESLFSQDNIQMFMGLFLLREKSNLQAIQWNGTSLYDRLNGLSADPAKINAVIAWVKASLQSYNDFSAAVTNIMGILKNDGTVTGSQLSACTTTLSAMINTVVSFPFNVFGITSPAPTVADIKIYSDQLAIIGQMAGNILDKNYGLAVAGAIEVISQYLKDGELLTLLKKYGSFTVSVAKASNKAEMLDALETAALPVGSYRIKRNAYKDISLNAYAGVAGGLQRYTNDVPANVSRTSGLLGFTAPVGIAYSWGFVSRKKEDKEALKGSSNTIFISVIDVGAVTAFRLADDSTKSLPDFKWENILAPGIFYIYGFKNSPISVSGGVQYGPQLRSIKNNSATILPSALSIRLGVLIDIPILNFYTRTEKRIHHEL